MSTPCEIPKRALIADDEADICSQIEEALRSVGWEVKTCTDGVAAEEALECFNPSVVVLDLRMPKKDGVKVLETIHATHPWTQVIILTGHGDEKAAIDCLNNGAFHFIKKPVSPLTIADWCNTALEHVPRPVYAFHDWFRKLPDPNRVIFQTSSGQKVTAAQLMDDITRQTPAGLDFIRQVESVAIELIASRL